MTTSFIVFAIILLAHQLVVLGLTYALIHPYLVFKRIGTRLYLADATFVPTARWILVSIITVVEMTAYTLVICNG